MITQQGQIKINLPIALKEFLESKASKYGMPITSYIKHLILEDVADMDYPAFEPSEKTVKAYKKAIKEQKKGKLIKVDDIDKFFNEL